MQQQHFKLTRHDFLYIGVIALVVVIWFHPFFVGGKVLVPPNANSGYPWYGTESLYAARS